MALESCFHSCKQPKTLAFQDQFMISLEDTRSYACLFLEKCLYIIIVICIICKIKAFILTNGCYVNLFHWYKCINMISNNPTMFMIIMLVNKLIGLFSELRKIKYLRKYSPQIFFLFTYVKFKTLNV